MTQVLALDSRDLALELYALLREIDPARWRGELETAARQKIAALDARLSQLLELNWPEELKAGLRDRLGELARLLREEAPALDLAPRDLGKEWKAFRARLQTSYDALARGLSRFDIHVPSLRPTNYARNAFHVGSALFALLLVEYVLSPAMMMAVAGLFAAYAWSMEAGRRISPRFNDRLMSFYGPVAHPHEWHRVNSSTWYASALLLLSFTRSPLLCAAALAVLGFGDPTAALIGRRWGRIRLMHGRSLEGTLAFVVASTLAAWLSLALWHPEAAGLASLAIALGAAVPGAVAELLARKIDDNLAVPVSAALGAWCVAAALGVPLR